LFNRIIDTLNSVQVQIFKNNVLFSSPSVSYNNTLPKLISITRPSTLSETSYEIYITNVLFSFSPDVDTINENTYEIRLTFNFTQDISWQNSNLNMLEFGYRVNTSIGSSVLNGASFVDNTSSGSNYTSSNFNLQNKNIFFNGTGEISSNEINTKTINIENSLRCNLIQPLNSNINLRNNLYVNSDNVNISVPLIFRNPLAGFYISGNPFQAKQVYNVICSTARLIGDADNYWVVNAGYKFVVYYDNNYAGNSAEINNVNGSLPLSITSLDV